MLSSRWLSLVLFGAVAVGLSACSTLDPFYTGRAPYPDARYPDNRRAPDYGRHDDYRRTSEYRQVRRDADRYTDFLDRELRLNGRQERAIETLLRRRAEDLLRRTHPRDHRYVYPFPRDGRNRAARSFWDRADRDINRILNRRQRDDYRYIARALDRGGERSYRRDRDRRGRGHDRGRGRGHDRHDDDWDDDDWDD